MRVRGVVASAVIAVVVTSACAATDSPAPGDTDAPSPSAGEVTGSGDTLAAGFDAHTPAEDPAELARRIGAAEDAVRDPATAADEVAAAGFELQVLYRQLGRRAQWEDRVLAAVPPRYRATVRAHLRARHELRAMHTQLSDTLPAWRIVEPAPASDLLAFYREGEATYGVDWEYLAAINLVETAMGRIRGTSTAGAQGPMQFIPATWSAYGEGDINDPHDAILAAARYLNARGFADGRIDDALYGYNNSVRYVRAVRAWASILIDDPRAFAGFYHWRVIYLSEIGDIWLPVGYEHEQRVPVRRHVRNHPERHLSTDTR